MKKIVTLLIFGLMSLASCTEYDEVAMWNKNEDMAHVWPRWRGCAIG